MSRPTHVTALVVVPAARRGSTVDLYRKDVGAGSLLRRGLAAAVAWPVDSVLVALGDSAEELLDDISDPVEVLIDPEWEEGPAATLRAGFDLIMREERSDAAIVVWLDRAVPDATSVGEVIEAAANSDRPIVATKYRYALDHPVLVRSELWGRVLGMEGAASLESLMATHPEWVTEVWVDSVPPRRYESAEDVSGRR